jgi:hypothetical protein
MSSPPRATCEKCVQLWRDYANATTEHVQLLKEQDQATGRDLARFKELEPLTEVAAEKRDTARATIIRHLAEEHAQETREMATEQDD